MICYRYVFFLIFGLSATFSPALANVALEPTKERTGVQTDAYGNVVLSGNGKTINFEADVFVGKAQSGRLALTRSSFLPCQLPSPEPSESSPVAADSPLRLEEIWSFRIWGTSIGRTGMHPVDLDGDGQVEIVLGTSSSTFGANSGWMIAEYDQESTQRNWIEWSSEQYASGIGSLAVVNIEGAYKILVGLGNGKLLVYDGISRGLEREIDVASSAINAIVYNDADNDDKAEILVLTSSDFHLLDPISWAAVAHYPYGGRDVVVGNVDADAQLEIILSGGQVLSIESGMEAVEWDFGVFGPGRYLDLSDIDGDGNEEIISARDWYYIDVYDGESQSPIRQFNTDHDIHALLMADITGDGRDELIYGDAQWGDIHILNPRSGVEIDTIANPEHGITRIAIADIDLDGNLELMWGAGWTSTGKDVFYVHDLTTGVNDFTSTDLVGPFEAVTLGDADNDNELEIVAISFESNSGYSDGVVLVFDAATYALEWQSSEDLFNRHAWTGVHDVKVGDVTGDGLNEIVVATDRLYDGAIYLLDGAKKTVKSSYLFDDGSPMYALALEDLDGDGAKEIIAGAGREHTGSPGTYVYVIDGRDGSEIWRSVSLTDRWNHTYSIAVAQVRGDAAYDLVISLDRVIVVDGTTRVLRMSPEADYRGIAVADLDGDGKPEIWAGTSEGELIRLNTDSLTREETWKPCTTAVNSVIIGQADSMTGVVQLACADKLVIFDPATNQTLWTSKGLWEPAGLQNNLVVFDTEEQSVMLAGHDVGLTAFEGFGAVNIDIDEDGINNGEDNCPLIANPDQTDTDGDRVGDACNDLIDSDGDEWSDRLDNCPAILNPLQRDTDGDRIGDACNNDVDADGDECADVIDNCSDVANANQGNRDGDEFGDVCDPYPDNPDNYAARCDEAIGNETRLEIELASCLSRDSFVDSDSDGEADRTDRCPETPFGSPVDGNGCSQSQFCRAQVREDFFWTDFRRCLVSDWRNDEPLSSNPRDCQGEMQRSGFSMSVKCDANF